MKKKVLAVILIAIVCSMIFVGCVPPADKYTEEEHIARVSKRVEKRYMQDGSEYTSYTVFPLYNADDELEFLLVEFEPYGFVYILIYNKSMVVTLVSGMYLRDYHEGQSWQRYTIKDGESVYETGENGEPIEYNDNHYKVAGVANERRYLLHIRVDEINSKYVPAIKHGDKYLNLVSMEEFDFSLGQIYEDQPVADITFIPKSDFKL